MTVETLAREKIIIIEAKNFVSNLLEKINGEIAIGSIDMLDSFSSLELSNAELTMWRVYATTHYCSDTERYKNECLPAIPEEVLACWDYAKETALFDKFEIFSSEQENTHEYILIGAYEEKHYLLARWSALSSGLVRCEHVLEQTKEKLRIDFDIAELPQKVRGAIRNFQMSTLSPIVYLEHENTLPLLSRTHCKNRNLVFRIDTGFMESELYDICPDCGSMLLMDPRYIHK